MLSRLGFDDNQAKSLVQETKKIIEFMDAVNSIDTDGVEPLYNVHEANNVFRSDEIHPPLPQSSIGDLAPSFRSGCFAVPKIIE